MNLGKIVLLTLFGSSVGFAQTTLSKITIKDITIREPTAAAPTFSPAAGAVSNPTTVTASSVSGCSSYIYFDTNSSPTTKQTTYSVTTAVTLYAQIRGCPGFLNSSVSSAAYTITIPNFGYSVVGSSSASSSGYLNGSIFTASATASYTTVHLYCSSTGGTGTALVGVYNSTSTTPSNESQVGSTSGTITCPSTAGWATASISASLTSGTLYALAVSVSGSTVLIYWAGTVAAGFQATYAYTGSMPNPFPTFTGGTDSDNDSLYLSNP